MKRTELKQIIKEVILKEANYDACFKTDYLHSFGISDTDIDKMKEMYAKIADKIGDSGSCVLGNGIMINGKRVIGSYAQGSIGIEMIQKEIIPFLKEKYPKLKISYEWGNMD